MIVRGVRRVKEIGRYDLIQEILATMRGVLTVVYVINGVAYVSMQCT